MTRRSSDLAGCRFGKLTALFREPTRNGRVFWRVRCECGCEKEVRASSLVGGLTRSCGCIRKSKCNGEMTRGMSSTREYQIWKGMRKRCKNPHNANFPLYGGRGIRVCEMWQNSFAKFIEDMGPCPDGYSLDRIDPDGPYSPANCRWATIQTQASNRRNCFRIQHGGRTVTMAALERELGKSPGALRYRALILGLGKEFDSTELQ